MNLKTCHRTEDNGLVDRVAAYLDAPRSEAAVRYGATRLRSYIDGARMLAERISKAGRS